MTRERFGATEAKALAQLSLRAREANYVPPFDWESVGWAMAVVHAN